METTIKNVEYADIQNLCEGDIVLPRKHGYINDPLILSSNWPKPFTRAEDGTVLMSSASQLMNFQQQERDLVLSVYHGDFQLIGHRLAENTKGFEDFSILTNVPYGVQSKEKQRQTDTDLHNLYRRFGKFLRTYPALEHNSFVLA